MSPHPKTSEATPGPDGSEVVLLFDIDGTLLDARGAGRRALERAVEEWSGRSLGSFRVDLGGRTDLDIFRELVRALGVPYPSPPDRRAVLRRYLGILEEELARTPPFVFPGVRELLGRTRRDGLAVTRDGLAVTRDGLAVTRDGLAVTRDGPAVTRDGPAVRLDGLPVTRDGLAVTRDGARDGSSAAPSGAAHETSPTAAGGAPGDRGIGHSRRIRVHHGLVTGNVLPGARRKLAAAGLVDQFDFRFGAFGNDHEDRNHLVPLALRRWRGGRALSPEPLIPASRAIVIGDTQNDVDCARAAGSPILIVGTGFGDYDALARQADAALPDLGDTDLVLETLARLTGVGIHASRP